MLRPAYRLVLGDEVVDSSDEPRASTLVELDVRLDLDTPADGFALLQGQVGGPSPDPDDEATIALGYADTGVEVVLTGAVTAVTPALETRRIVGLSTAGRLLRHHANETFEAMTAGEIVRALADEAGVDVARVDDGLELPAYVVDGRRSAAAHVRDLAALAGLDTYVTADGELVFEEFSGNRTAHELKAGVHVLGLHVRRRREAAATVEVWGESPGASRGTESWAWLTKDFEPYHGSAGSGAPVLLAERSAVRTAEAAAASATRGHVTVERAATTGRVRIPGRPEVRLGDVVRLTGFDDGALAGNHQVRSVHHRLTKAHGFTTDIGFRSIGEVSP